MTSTASPPLRLLDGLGDLSDPSDLPDLSATERHRAGRARRLALPREALASVPHRDPLEAVCRLAAEDAVRPPDLLQERYARLLQSPFSYLCGSAGVMAADLATQLRTGLGVQLCGDANVGNFGVFATPDRRLVFDVDDFDETLPGCFEWDLKRLVTSIAVLGRTNGHARRERVRAAKGAVAAYRWAMHAFCDEPTLDVWFRPIAVDDLVSAVVGQAPEAERPALQAAVRRALAEATARPVESLTCVVDGRSRFVSAPASPGRLVDLHPGVAEADLWTDAMAAYTRYLASVADDRRRLLELYRLVDVARKAVGVGGYGPEAYVLLLQGPAPQDVLVLQVRQAGPSVLEAYVGGGGFEHHAERVVAGQRRIQAVGDPFLAWQWHTRPDGRTADHYVRQVRSGSPGVDLASMSPERLEVWAKLCGWTLARAHARSGDRFAIAGYLGCSEVLDEALAYFAEKYADCVVAQYAAVSAARDLDRRGAVAP